jgi:DNA-directed RNA polymerase subunit RPC12/RpoP
MCKCEKCNSTNTGIVDFIDRIEDENLYQYQCEDCGYTFLGSVKLNDMERITAILKEFNNTEITNINECIKACEGAWSKIANISSQWEAQMGLNNVYKDDLDVLENYIKELKMEVVK